MSFLILAPAIATLTGVLRQEWLDPTGVLHDLTQATSPNLHVSRGSTGMGSPPIELVLEKLPFAPGSTPRHIRTGPAEIELPITVQASSFANLLASVETLRDWFDTGDERSFALGYLRITRPQDDGVRQIGCLYRGGLEGDLGAGSPTWAPLVVSLQAPYPYWTDTSDTVETYDQDDLGDALGVVNVGDFDAFPVWTCAGPLSALTITNTTTGKAFALTANGGLAISAGQTLVVDTRPVGQRSGLPVLVGGTVSRYDRLSAGSALWQLEPGAQSFTIAASGTSVATSFSLAWLPLYRGALR